MRARRDTISPRVCGLSRARRARVRSRSMRAMAESRSRPRRLNLGRAFVVFALALAVRLAALLVLAPAELVGDESYYWDDYAGAINRGEFLTPAQQIRPPLWGFVLALPHQLHPGATSGRAFGALVGALACLAVFRLAREVYDEKVAFAGGIVQALLPEHMLFSTYLWSEVLFGLLIVISCTVFFRKQHVASTRRAAFGAFSILGVAFLSKEFAVVPFVAMLAILFRRKACKGTVALCILLFMLPAATYSLASSLKNDRPFFLSRAAIANLGQTGLLPFRPQDDVSAQLARVVEMIRARTVPDTAHNALTQVAKLWGFHSFCVWRLLRSPQSPGACVGGPFPFTAVVVSTAYASVFVLGLCGLNAARGEFRWFSIAALVLLTSTGAIGFLVSRFRIPFLFLLTIHTGVLLAAPAHAYSSIKRSAPARILIAAAVGIMVYGGIRNFGRWG